MEKLVILRRLGRLGRLGLLGALWPFLCVQTALAAEPALNWTAATGAQPGRSQGAGAFYKVCGERDSGLERVAAQVLARRLAGRMPYTERQLRQLVRAAGIAQVWPRAWLGRVSPNVEAVGKRFVSWLRIEPSAALRRCGIARGSDHQGHALIAVLAVPTLGDLEPLPRRVTSAQWLRLRAVLHAEAHGVQVILLGPRGRPKRVLSSLDGGQVRSRFRLDAAGRWLVQVVAMLPGGPRPALEAVVFVDVDPPSRLDKAARDRRGPQTASALRALLNRARQRAGLPILRRDPTLERLAKKHARAMQKRGRLAHDVGDGLPTDRAYSAGLPVRRLGENVARAPNVGRLHRALWNSPSHRDNMLDPAFAWVGVALSRDHRGRLWAVQLFAR